MGLVPKAREVANPNGNRDRSGVSGGRIYLLLTGFIWNEFSCFSLSYWICYHIAGYLQRFSFLVSSSLSIIDSGSCTINLIVPALCRCTYAVHIPFYRERPVSGYQLTHAWGVFVFDRGSGLGKREYSWEVGQADKRYRVYENDCEVRNLKPTRIRVL